MLEGVLRRYDVGNPSEVTDVGEMVGDSDSGSLPMRGMKEPLPLPLTAMER